MKYEPQKELYSRSIDEAMLVGSEQRGLWSDRCVKEGMIGSFWSAWEALILHIANNLFNCHHWRIHRDEICAIKEHQNRKINKAMLVGSWAYDTLDALKRVSQGRFGRLEMRPSCMLATIHSTGVVGASIEMEYVLLKSFKVVVLMKLCSLAVGHITVQML